MNFEPSKSLCAGDAPAPDQRPDRPSPPAVPKKKREGERPEEERPRRVA
jgi:hypothetical protein